MEYTVSSIVNVSCYTIVEAESEEEAREIAFSRELNDLCHGPFVGSADEGWNIDTDGEPRRDYCDVCEGAEDIF